jgi:hypothetical protein
MFAFTQLLELFNSRIKTKIIENPRLKKAKPKDKKRHHSAETTIGLV